MNQKTAFVDEELSCCLSRSAARGAAAAEVQRRKLGGETVEDK
jgi:hypothetical protein